LYPQWRLKVLAVSSASTLLTGVVGESRQQCWRRLKQVSGHGLRLEVQTPLWRSEFGVTKGNELATLAVFTQRAIHQEKVVPIRFGNEANQFSLRKRSDGQVLVEFKHQESVERVPLSTLQLYELEILAHYALHRAFEPSDVSLRSQVPPPSATAVQIA
jgi:hypothetical protein